MTKIWEVDFTSISGTDVLDNVGSQKLSSSNMTVVNPLPGFTYRPGLGVSRDGSAQNCGMYTYGATNSYFTGTWNTRSFVSWVYLNDPTSEGVTYLWGEGSSSSSADDGINLATGMNVYFLINSSSRYVETGLTTPAWYCFIMTVDKVTPESRFYVNGVYKGNYTGTSYRSTAWTYGMVGHVNITQESSFLVGQLSTYDHILTQTEIDNIQDSFLVDRSVAYPYQWVSGTVFGNDGSSVVSGADVYVISESSEAIVAHTLTSSDGTFTADIPLEGNYTVVTTSTPNSGAAAFPVIATSGNIYYP